MILIITNTNDTSTYEVVEWLKYYNEEKVYLVTSNCKYDLIEYSNTRLIVKFEDFTIDLFKIKTCWYRKGDIYLNTKLLNHSDLANARGTIISEMRDLHDAVHEILRPKYRLSNYFVGDLNRLNTLNIAQKIGFNIPNYIVTGSKNNLNFFINKYNKVIIRSINQGISYSSGGYSYQLFVNQFRKKDLATLQDNFYPTLFMELIKKRFEIRVFYLRGKCYSMAIFSQVNNKTKLDFRNYDEQNPNKTVPFKLPIYMEKNIHKLMKRSMLDSGSIDLIYTPTNEYIFLEINPVGQFGMVSKPCNYYLEKAIAKNLL
jgi:ATP-GRASP peptide maturase of grasp-with-spasm system